MASCLIRDLTIASENWSETYDENCFSLPAGDTVYGRVMVDPVQNLGDSFICSIEKVFLCTGTDGYVPKYNPSNFEFGCLADAPSLLYRFKIIVSNKLLFGHFGGFGPRLTFFDSLSSSRTRHSQKPRQGHSAV